MYASEVAAGSILYVRAGACWKLNQMSQVMYVHTPLPDQERQFGQAVGGRAKCFSGYDGIILIALMLPLFGIKLLILLGLAVGLDQDTWILTYVSTSASSFWRHQEPEKCQVSSSAPEVLEPSTAQINAANLAGVVVFYVISASVCKRGLV